MANANFTPDIGPYTTLKPFRFWCQKVLPLVYDDSLSYYELLGKVVDYLNKTMEDVDTQITDIQGLLSAYEALQDWVNHYYDSADFAADIDAGLDRMAESGQLNTLLTPIVTDQLPALADTLIPESVFVMLPDVVEDQIPGTVATQLPGVVSNQIGGTVATQLPGVVSNQIGGTVANQLPAVVSNQIGPVVEDKIVDPVEDWLDANVSGGIAVDRTLSVLGAGADAAFTGARLETLDDTLGYEHVADTGFIITTANPFAFNYEYINDNDIFSDQGTHTYKMIVVPVNTGDKYCINAHKISVPETENHFAVTYAFCAKYVGDPDTDTPYYLPTIYSRNNAENLIATVPEITIPTGLSYDETTGYLVVITANIEDPVYKVTGSDFATVDYVDDEIDAVNEAVEGLEADLAGKADTDGTYPYLTAGSAQQLTSDQVVTDQKPYLFRRTGADATREYDTLVGGSVVSNQIVDSNDTAVTLTSGRKYYTVISGTAAIQAGTGAPISVTGGTDMVIDLTQMFGSAIADYAYTLEQSTPGSGIAWLKSYGFFGGYQAYNAGAMVHVSGVSEHVMTGFNQWDEEWELGAYNTTTGQKEASALNIRCKNYIPVLPNTTYYDNAPSDHWIIEYDSEHNRIWAGTRNAQKLFTTHEKGKFITFYMNTGYGITYNHDICINLSNPAKNGQYEPYTEYSYILDDTLTLRGIPKLSNGEIHYDGDTYAHDGKVTRRYALVDLGTLTWNYSQELFVAVITGVKKPSTQTERNKGFIFSSTYMPDTQTSITSSSMTDKTALIYNGSENMYIKDTFYTDAATFKASLSGVYLLYELQTPTTETATPYQSPQICDPDGTEEYITDGIPVGHETQYPANLKGAIERIMIQVPPAPAAAGTYMLTCTVDSSGSASYEWAATTGRTLGAIRPVDQIQDQIREPAADPDEIQKEIQEPEADQETNPDDIQDAETDPE